MLEGLDQVPWRQLHHAFGTAEDVPALIRASASTEESERSSALYELHGNLWHQGTIYEATPHAVPFLIDLATAQEIPGRSELLSYPRCTTPSLGIAVSRSGIWFAPCPCRGRADASRSTASMRCCRKAHRKTS